MAANRRSGEVSKILLIEAAVEIITHEGYGALTARRLAEKVGLKRQIIHYYFGTIDDLLLAVVRHYGETGLARFAEAFASADPLRVIWETDPDTSATTFAFMAMATHNPLIRAEMRRYLEANRDLQTKAIEQHFAKQGRKLALPARAASIIVQCIAQGLAAEETLGTVRGHAETKKVVEDVLRRLAEGGAQTPAAKPQPQKRKPRSRTVKS